MKSNVRLKSILFVQAALLATASAAAFKELAVDHGAMVRDATQAAMNGDKEPCLSVAGEVPEQYQDAQRNDKLQAAYEALVAEVTGEKKAAVKPTRAAKPAKPAPSAEDELLARAKGMAGLGDEDWAALSDAERAAFIEQAKQ